MEKIRVLIADDHKIFRDGIKSLLDREKDILVIGEASNSGEVLAQVNETAIDVVLMDIDMGKPNGIETTRIIKENFPDVNILILSMMGLPEFISQALEMGATGYLLKNTGKEEVLAAIRSVAKGDSYFSKEVSTSLVDILYQKSNKHRKNSKTPLSNREIEVLKLIALEYSNAEIAKELFISIRTVDTHRRNLLEKLNVKNTAGLVKYAISNSLIK